MSNAPVLVVLAAGMGSRYGGLKQIDPVGSHGEAILDYSIFDAYEAGFRTAVILIKEAIREDFMATVGKRLAKSPMEIRYAYQELSKLPEGYAVPEGRVKPFGTGHAVICAGEEVGDAPFAVINADDYYGKAAFKTIFEFLSGSHDPYGYCMVGYRLDKTVTENGSVARGVCATDETGNLLGITERTRIEKYDGGIHFTEDGQNWQDLAPDTIVSMNLMGFQPSFLREAKSRFPAFLDKALKENPLKGEYFLPSIVQQLLSEGKATMKVLTSPDQWYGVTYAADKPVVVKALADMAKEGLYPQPLF
ncbi:MAG: nucleotidyltransferase [Candidatus Faecousia sp.]|nr:nucleotidyltransferase [Bacillota bacterium]MDY4755773.1 nucleotidyltransferase [Candidatus Faecousia sp.]MDY6159878.1 nucleotidyltransferase [Candidatus Faecousia sp.]